MCFHDGPANPFCRFAVPQLGDFPSLVGSIEYTLKLGAETLGMISHQGACAVAHGNRTFRVFAHRQAGDPNAVVSSWSPPESVTTTRLWEVSERKSR